MQQHQSSSVSFENKLEFDGICTQVSTNFCLADVDDDGDMELVVCSWQSRDLKEYGEADVENSPGSVSILKQSKLWRTAEFYGMVTCVAVGNVFNLGQNLVVCLCTDSYCYVFDVFNVKPVQKSTATTPKSRSEEKCPVMNIFQQKRIPQNAKDVIISDIDGDGLCEMLVAYTDRTVRMFRWQSTDVHGGGDFITLCKWDLAGQIGSVTLHWTPDRGTLIMASQPGGAYVILNRPNLESDDTTMHLPTLTYDPLNSKNARNRDIKTEIVGNIRKSRSTIGSVSSNTSSVPPVRSLLEEAASEDVEPSEEAQEHRRRRLSMSGEGDTLEPYFAICTMDGTIKLLDHKNVIWDLQVDRELFGLCQVDLTHDSAEEVVVCSWDGLTYIVNRRREVVRFHSGAPCQAFTAGSYAVTPGRNQAVLIYSTFDNRIVIYYNMSFTHVPCVSVKHKLTPAITQHLQNHGIDPSNENQIRWAIRWLLYEKPKIKNV